ncbi:hypothetical protein ATK30_0382 [Amycolatopsis echigonensis]|uniref:Oxidoreductase n=1 Tax=Amycolatopsis echigonensis TaxID=2576905 RepID=A0A2N3WZW8_9PSEU|nr:hypothetical protein [Amycolatopsis niigatensis]PKV99415.1 hypothetical protein ATK30_0382 [Amycolatopsis niigatensis]
MNRIRLVPTIRERSKYQRERRYLDFEVDGVSLRSLVDTGLDLISVLVTDRPRDPPRLARVLGEAPGDAPDGRVLLYVCPECEDIECGAVASKVLRRGDLVTWRDFGVPEEDEADNEFAETTVSFSARQLVRELADR